MLYRNPDSPPRRSLWQHARHMLALLRLARRRRLAQLDLMSASPHLKRDLGLHDVGLRSLI